ncbi:transcription factor bHLH120-like protein [Salvia divinorum]|uniref:Transcription factor bHLH120-like protein n=1 Tax=Salvia divinorum TaxID=28513 RepID=A0ABD1FHY5_SALDI
MFPISSDGVFEDPLMLFEQDGFLQDLLEDINPISEVNNHSENSVKKRARKVEESNNGSSDSKKSAHRFIEKQRRQEMSALYASLRSLLPLEYIKGKRAVSDHMHQAANYISDMKKKIEEMKLRRGILRNVDQKDSNGRDSSSYCVKMNSFRDGFEILISSKECSPLSTVLGNLIDRNLDVVSCVSSRGDGCYLHKIHVEINDSTRIDLSELQEQLVNLLQLA